MIRSVFLLSIFLLSSHVMAEPGTARSCGAMARQAANIQEGRQLDIPDYADSSSAIQRLDAMLSRYIEERKPSEGFIAYMKKHNEFVVRNVYRQSKSNSPASVAEHINRLCLIDVD